ncbi:hypothetical protein [[Eubacterium] hominis]|uniref:hypothetical protein n=1 Tax=[Eubacterium] hominis TaxID=2764325 RepID=UPI003A4D2C61
MKTKKFLLTGAVAFVAAAAFGMPVSAAENAPAPDSTTVTYTNNSSIDGDSGVWGVVVPTAYSFTDANLTSTGVVELIGINGYTLDELNDSLAVQVKAKSEHSYDVVDGANTIAYSVKYGTNTVDKTTAVDADSFTTDAVTELTKAAPKTSTTATLSQKGTVKGNYTDKITYKVSHTGDELK